VAETSGGFDIAALARRIARYRWAETTLFEALGGWVATVPEAEIKVCLAAHGAHHAWHAQLWAERMPALPGISPDGPAAVGLRPVAAALVEPEQTIERLVGVYRVALPRLIGAYTAHRRRTSVLTDAPTVRTLTLVLRDELDDWREGELLLQSLIRTPEHAARAAARQGALEELHLTAGGVTG
jgi:hypothetical protein